MAVTHRIPGLVLTEHELRVPLDHQRPDGREITIFAREVAADDGAGRPFLVFLQGGPGYEAPRPLGRDSPGWLDRALRDFRVLMLDQRGTGRSTPVGVLAAPDAPRQAEYLTHFRADSIVADAEAFRQHLGVARWSLLGQSFGGFTALAYLSQAPEGVSEALFTGGLPPIGRHIDEVYDATYERVRERNARYYERYPEDRDRVRRLCHRLESEELRLPSGDRLTPARLRQAGALLGASQGFEQLHYLLELDPGSPAFLHDVASTMGFARNPLYAVIHEASYADGCATRWSAQRRLPPDYAEDPTLLSGEHVYPWMFEDFGALRPLREAAGILAEHEWTSLYDAERLRDNDVPAAAAIYVNDMYVERAFSEETAATVRGMRPWITNEYEHNGLRVDGARILDRLLDLARGRV